MVNKDYLAYKEVMLTQRRLAHNLLKFKDNLSADTIQGLRDTLALIRRELAKTNRQLSKG